MARAGVCPVVRATPRGVRAPAAGYVCVLGRRQPAHLDQLEAERLDAVEQPVEAGLVPTGPWRTVSVEATSASMPSRAARAASLTRPRTRIS